MDRQRAISIKSEVPHSLGKMLPYIHDLLSIAFGTQQTFDWSLAGFPLPI